MATSIIKKPVLEDMAIAKLVVPANGNLSYLLPADGQFILCGGGWQSSVNSIMYLIGGYATASRFRVTEIQANSYLTIDKSNTENRTIVLNNASDVSIYIRVYKTLTTN